MKYRLAVHVLVTNLGLIVREIGANFKGIVHFVIKA